jgi:hypothetical protein
MGQIYLGSEAFIAQHQPNRAIQGIPRRQTQAQRPPLRILFQRKERSSRLIDTAYRPYGYRLVEIADHLGVHPATISRRLKQAEPSNLCLEGPDPEFLLSTFHISKIDGLLGLGYGDSRNKQIKKIPICQWTLFAFRYKRYRDFEE